MFKVWSLGSVIHGNAGSVLCPQPYARGTHVPTFVSHTLVTTIRKRVSPFSGGTRGEQVHLSAPQTDRDTVANFGLPIVRDGCHHAVAAPSTSK
jgi:hypothetical protein